MTHKPTHPATMFESDEGAHAATRIGRNFSFRLVSQVLSSLINVAGMVLLGNYLHAEGYGRYAFFYALVPLIGSLGDLGVGIIVTREIARDRTAGARTFGDALVIKGMVSGVIFLAVAIGAWLQFEPLHAILLCLVAAAALTEISQDASVWVFRAHERQDVESLLLIVSQVVWLGGLALGVAFQLSILYLIGTTTVAFLIRVGVGAFLVLRMLYPPVFSIDWTRLRSLVAQGLPFGLAMFGVVLYGRVGVLMLQGLSSSAEVAFFNVAYLLSQPLGFISSALSLAAYPVFARYARRGRETVGHALRKTSKYQLLVTLPVLVGLFLLAERVIPLLFRGEDFQQAGLALKIMSLGLVFIFLNLMARYVLAAIDRQQVYLRAIVVGLLVNVALCAALIPPFGFRGACVAYLGAETAILLVCQATLRRFLGAGALIGEAVRPGLAALGMGLVVAALRDGNLFLVVGTGAAVYVGLLFLLRVFSNDELQILRSIVASFRVSTPGITRPGWGARGTCGGGLSGDRES